MVSCCSNQSCASTENCPECGATSKTVDFKTVLHQLKFPDVFNMTEEGYYFCADQTCALVYFFISNKGVYKQQVNVFGASRAAKLCYCFDVDKAAYIQALTDNSAEKIKRFVVQKTKTGLCACAVKNPSGRCCLVDFISSHYPKETLRAQRNNSPGKSR